MKSPLVVCKGANHSASEANGRLWYWPKWLISICRDWGIL